MTLRPTAKAHGLGRRDFHRLLAVAEWRSLPPGAAIIREGRPVEQLVLLHRGTVACTVGGRQDDLVDDVRSGGGGPA